MSVKVMCTNGHYVAMCREEPLCDGWVPAVQDFYAFAEGVPPFAVGQDIDKVRCGVPGCSGEVLMGTWGGYRMHTENGWKP